MLRPPCLLRSRGQEVRLYDGRPNGELLLGTGVVEAGNPADCLMMEAGLVGADRLYARKMEILQDLGMGECGAAWGRDWNE